MVGGKCHHGLESHNLFGHVGGDHRRNRPFRHSCLQGLPVSAGGTHDKGNPVPDVNRHFIDRGRMGIVNGDQIRKLLQKFRNSSFPVFRFDQRDRGALDPYLVIRDIRAGQ